MFVNGVTATEQVDIPLNASTNYLFKVEFWDGGGFGSVNVEVWLVWLYHHGVEYLRVV